MTGGLIAAFAIAVALQSAPQTAPARPPAPSYTIAVTIAPEAKRLDGRARILWRNDTASPVREIQLHSLYNALPGGSMALTRLRDAIGDRDLLAGAQRVAGSESRPSVIRVPLPAAVPPGGDLTIDAQWTATIPDAAVRGQCALVAHWFPQLAVLSGGEWTAHQNAARSYVFADASAFDVTIDAPPGWNVIAAGREAQPAADVRGRRFVLADASDFAFAAGRTWIERRTPLERIGGDPIDLRLALQPEHARHAERIVAGVQAALARADSAVAPYPYSTLTILDLPWRSAAEGEVFPAFVTLTTPWIAPLRVTDLEAAIAQGLARHAWQAVVPADAVAHAWLVDELSAYAALRLAEPLVQRQLASASPAAFLTAHFFGGFLPYAIRAVRVIGERHSAPETLERYVGFPAFEMILSEYGRQFRFAHPTPQDVLRVAESVSGRDLKWFFDDAFDTRRRFDYAIQEVRAERLSLPPRYRTTVMAARLGDGVFSGSSRAPVAGFQSGRAIEIATSFADGTTLRDAWDGRASTTTMTYESVAPVASVAIDPDRILALDARRTNNSWAAHPNAASTATRWSVQWLAWLEHLLLTYGLLV